MKTSSNFTITAFFLGINTPIFKITTQKRIRIKGSKTRFKCPKCESKQAFTRYIDIATNCFNNNNTTLSNIRT